MNDINNQALEESQNPPQNISYAASRVNNNQSAALAHVQANNYIAEEEQEQIVTSTSSDTQASTSGHLPQLEALTTSPARITSSTGNDCSSSPQRVLSTTCSSGGRSRQSTQYRGDITTTDASSEDESQSPHQSTQSSFSGKNILKPGSAVRAFSRATHGVDSAMPTTSAAAAKRTAGFISVESELRASNSNKSSISILSNGGLEHTNGGDDDPGSANMVAREQTTVAVAPSDEATTGHAVAISTGSGQGQVVPAEQTTESHKIILKLPKPNATSGTVRSLESQSNIESMGGEENAASHSGIEPTRKVEPLKINLHIHNNPNIVPKITIKPIMKKPNDIASSDCSSSAEDDTVAESCSTRSGAQIPKLTIKAVGGSDEPHIVPKLTIRSANDSSDSSVVPKLTIKMSDSQAASHSINTQSGPSAASASSAVPAKSRAEHSPPPLPKLTIKTSLDGTSESIMSTISPASSSSSSSSTSSSVGVLSLSSTSATASCTVSNSTKNACSVPKLTIKTLQPKHEELVPKLTIKTNATGACVSTSTAATTAEDNGEVHDGGNISGINSKIPKLTIKTGQEHAVIITQHNDDSNAQIIPKLTIKTKSLDAEESLSDLSEDPAPPPEKIPKITIKTHETAAETTAPKFCIKTLQQQTDTENAHAIPKLTISMANLEGGAAPQSPKQSPLVVRQLSSSTRKPESPERLPKLMISRHESKGNNCEAAAEKVVPKLTIKTNSQDGSGNECMEKIPKLTIKSIHNVGQQSSEESDECLSGESSPPLSAAEEAVAANKVVPKLTIKNLSSPTLKMKAVLEDKTQRNASKKCGKSSDPKSGIETSAVCVVPQRPLDQQQSTESSARDQLVNGCESSSSQEFCGFNNDNAAFVAEVDIEELRRNSDDMDIDEGLQQHDPQVFNNVFHVSNGDSLRIENVEDSQLMQPPLPVEDLSNVVDTVDLTSSPSPGSSPAHFTYTDADPQISDAQQPPHPTILMERLQREMSVIQTAPPMESTNSFLLNQLNAPLNVTKYGTPPPLQPKPQQSQQHHQHLLQQPLVQQQQQRQQIQQQISNSIKYPQLTERLMANGARIRQNSTITCASSVTIAVNSGAASINMACQQAVQPEKVIDSIEILDTPEGSPRLTLGDTAALPQNLHVNNEDGLNEIETGVKSVCERNSADMLRHNNNVMDASTTIAERTNQANLKRHAETMSALMMENDRVPEQCIEITPNKVRRIDSESHTMATLTILTDDESSNTKLITTSPTIFGGNHHVVDITNDFAQSQNAPVTMDISSPKSSMHRSRKQRHEHLLAIPLDEEERIQLELSNDVSKSRSSTHEHATSVTKVGASDSDQLPAATPIVRRRGRPKKNVLNNSAAVTPNAATAPTQATATSNEPSVETADAPPTEVVSKARRVELLRKRLAIDMVDAEQPLDEQESVDVANESESSTRDRALRTGARSSRRSILPGGAITPVAKFKPGGANNSEVAIKNRKRPVNMLGSGGNNGVGIGPNAVNNNAANSIPEAVVTSVLNHYGGSNSSLSSTYSSSSMSSATMTTAAGTQLGINNSTAAAISLATQIDLTMCSSSSSASNGSITATMTIAGASNATSTCAINAAVQNQSSSSMLPPATILSSSDPVPDVVFRPNDFSSLMATQQLRAPHTGSTSVETDLLRMQTTLISAKYDGCGEETTSGGGGDGSGADLSGDDSTTSSMGTPLSRGRGGRGRGRGSGRGSARGNRAHRLGRGASAVAKQIALSRPRCVGGLKHTPDPDRMKGLFSPSPQVFEEDTRMSADLTQSHMQLQLQAEPQIPMRHPDFLNNDESQSSVLSTNSILDPNTVAAVQNGSAIKRPKKKKMEVCVAEDAEITVSAIAEYEWPPPKGCCPSKNRDTFMIQEQVALYLGIKSFKRKYPDLPRRQIDMEERNWLQEKGLVSERMCDLGITAVWASDILDIMYTDFYAKYEEYKDFIRQKHLREIEAKQKALGLNVSGRGLQARERALLSTSKWNAYFNKSRKEERLACLDLQTLTVNVPLPATAPTATLVYRSVAEAVAEAAKAEQIPEPPTLLRPRVTTPPRELDANYPVAVVSGQYCKNYRKYTPFELSCFPLNTVLQDPRLLGERVEHTAEQADTTAPNVKPLVDTRVTTEPTDSNADVVNCVNNTLPLNTMRRSERSHLAIKAKSLGETCKEENGSDTESAMSSSESESECETSSDTDSDSSSDDTSSSSEEEGDAPATCGVCHRTQNRNMKNLPEVFIRCYTCRRRVHPSCIEMPHRMVARVRNYNWQCVDCKCCIKCRGKKDQNKMLYCEQCDRGFHIYCLGIKAVTDSRWSCERCSVCIRCGATKPEGLPQQQLQISPNGEKVKQIKHKKVKWINEYRIDHITKLREHCSMLCVPCGRARGAKRVQIASPCVSGTAATSSSPPAATQQKQPAKILSQNQTTASTEGANSSGGATSKGYAAVASTTNKTSAAGTLPPPPPVVA